ncbi:hypothetical protein HanPSC8_Chr16g0725621 [Helianthus annuus]|nr:hypothetical protein HanPSC8_Chr16g0725621 [Helianthus annuus]
MKPIVCKKEDCILTSLAFTRSFISLVVPGLNKRSSKFQSFLKVTWRNVIASISVDVVLERTSLVKYLVEIVLCSSA